MLRGGTDLLGFWGHRRRSCWASRVVSCPGDQRVWAERWFLRAVVIAGASTPKELPLRVSKELGFHSPQGKGSCRPPRGLNFHCQAPALAFRARLVILIFHHLQKCWSSLRLSLLPHLPAPVLSGETHIPNTRDSIICLGFSPSLLKHNSTWHRIPGWWFFPLWTLGIFYSTLFLLAWCLKRSPV